MKYVLKKLLTVIATILIVSFLTFMAFQLISGDPVTQMLGTEATPEKIAALRSQMGLDQPILLRYIKWLGGFFTGDLGTSYSYNLPVSEIILEKLPTTALLTGISFLITVLISIPLGVFLGSIKNKALDRFFAVFNQLFMSIPAFFLGIFISYFFGLVLRMFIPGNFIAFSESPVKCIGYLIFPAIAVAVPRIASVAKMLRGSVMSEMSRDYVRAAQSHGLSRNLILSKHVLRNAILPVVTFLAISLAEMMTGVIIIEQIFTIPGLGRLLLASISSRDFPVVQAIVVILAAWIVVVNFLGDLVNRLIDPRLWLK